MNVQVEGGAGAMISDTRRNRKSHGTDDRSAAQFARDLTRNLRRLTGTVPVSQIEDFAKLQAGFSWLIRSDPYRDLDPWLHARLARAATPTQVQGLARSAEVGPAIGAHRYELRLSGGVMVKPGLKCSRSGDDALMRLRRAILSARPARRPLIWKFTIEPDTD